MALTKYLVFDSKPSDEYVPPEYSDEAWKQISDAERQRLYLTGRASFPPPTNPLRTPGSRHDY